MKSLSVLLLISSVFAFGQQNDDHIKSKIDSILQHHYPASGPGAVILVTKDGHEIFKSAYGLANVELNVPLHSGSVLKIGSITKQFTAVSILLLVQRGKLSLKDPVTKFFPQFMNKNNITITNLLTHTGGIKDFSQIAEIRALSNRTTKPDQLIEILAKEPLDFPPGSRYGYSNSGYLILGAILEKVSGMTYKEFLEKEIFTPLGMDESCYCDNATVIQDRATGYFSRPTGYVNAMVVDNSLLYAAGGILSTLADMAKWNEALSSNKIIKRSLLEKAFTPFVLSNGDSTDYGFGFRTANINGVTSIEHGGGAFGFNSYGIRMENERLYTIILSNFEGGNKYDEVAASVTSFVIGRPYEKRTSNHVSPKVLSQYQGQYLIAEGDTVTVSFEQGQLFYSRTDGKKKLLTPIGQTEFLLEGSLDDRVTFFSKGKKVEYLLAKPRRSLAVKAPRI